MAVVSRLYSNDYFNGPMTTTESEVTVHNSSDYLNKLMTVVGPLLQ